MAIWLAVVAEEHLQNWVGVLFLSTEARLLLLKRFMVVFGDVELLYHMVLEGFITDEGEAKGQEDAQAFDEATTISHPVQYTVDIAIDSI